MATLLLNRMRLRWIIAAGLLAVSAQLMPAADPGLLSLAMPDARVMIGVNVEQARVSPFGRYLIGQFAGHEAELQSLIDASGFDPRRDVREVLIASNGESGGRSGLVLARGTFDVARIIEAALSQGQTAEVYKNVEILSGDPLGKQTLAFLDETLVVAGEPADVRAAIDRRSAAGSSGSGMAAQVNQLSASQDVWFVSLVPPSLLVANATMLDKVLQASGGVKFGSDVVLTLRTVSQTDKEATALADSVKMFASMAFMGSTANARFPPTC